MALLRRCLNEVRLQRGDATVLDQPPPYRMPGRDDAGPADPGHLLSGETSFQLHSPAANGHPVRAA